MTWMNENLYLQNFLFHFFILNMATYIYIYLIGKERNIWVQILFFLYLLQEQIYGPYLSKGFLVKVITLI